MVVDQILQGETVHAAEQHHVDVRRADLGRRSQVHPIGLRLERVVVDPRPTLRIGRFQCDLDGALGIEWKPGEPLPKRSTSRSNNK